jgi:molybdenum cofactor cytidylyltransferase
VLPKQTTHLILVTGLDAVGNPLDHMHVHRAHLFSQNMDLPLGHPVDARAIAACAAIEIKKAQGLCHPAVTIYCLNKADTDHRIADARAIRMHLAAESNIDSIVTTCLCRESPVIEYVDKKKPASKKISGIILAAGSSTRMGRTKQLLPFKNTTLLGQVMENARAAALHEIIVVLGHDADTISKTLDFSGITVIRNPDYLNGQSTSLVKGIEKVSRASDAAMFLLADQPLVTPGLINRLLEAFNTRPAPIVIPCYQGQRGNPVIIARRLFHQLSALSADTGARALFDRFKDHLLKVSVPDDSILVDVDTPDAYETLLSRISRE